MAKSLEDNFISKYRLLAPTRSEAMLPAGFRCPFSRTHAAASNQTTFTVSPPLQRTTPSAAKTHDEADRASEIGRVTERMRKGTLNTKPTSSGCHSLAGARIHALPGAVGAWPVDGVDSNLSRKCRLMPSSQRAKASSRRVGWRLTSLRGPRGAFVAPRPGIQRASSTF